MLVNLPSLHSLSPSHPDVVVVSLMQMLPEMQKFLVLVTFPHCWLLESSRPQVLVAVASLTSTSGMLTVLAVPTEVARAPTVERAPLLPDTTTIPQSWRWGQSQVSQQWQEGGVIT